MREEFQEGKEKTLQDYRQEMLTSENQYKLKKGEIIKSIEDKGKDKDEEEAEEEFRMPAKKVKTSF